MENQRKSRGKKDGSFVIYRCLIPDTRDRRRWYISNVPEGCHPGTEKDINYYSPEANFFDTVPPQTNWVDDHKGSPPIPRFCRWDHHGSMVDSNTKTILQNKSLLSPLLLFHLRGKSSERGGRIFLIKTMQPALEQQILRFCCCILSYLGEITIVLWCWRKQCRCILSTRDK